MPQDGDAELQGAARGEEGPSNQPKPFRGRLGVGLLLRQRPLLGRDLHYAKPERRTRKWGTEQLARTRDPPRAKQSKIGDGGSEDWTGGGGRTAEVMFGRDRSADGRGDRKRPSLPELPPTRRPPPSEKSPPEIPTSRTSTRPPRGARRTASSSGPSRQASIPSRPTSQARPACGSSPLSLVSAAPWAPRHRPSFGSSQPG